MSKPLLLLLSGFVLGYSYFHSQADLDSFWIWVSPTVLQIITALIALLFLRMPALNTPAQFGLLALSTVLAFGLAASQAAINLDQKVPLDCHQTSIKSEFELQDARLGFEGKSTLIFRHVNNLNCLSENSVVQGFYEASDWKIGHLYTLKGKLKSTRAAHQFEGFDLESYRMAQGIAGLINLQSAPIAHNTPRALNVLASLKQLRLNTTYWLLKTNGKSAHNGLVVALITGDQGLLTTEDRQIFADTGIAHLVAISGLHITLLALVAGRGFGLLWRQSSTLLTYCSPQLVGSLFGITFALAYALASGWAVPAQRTILMLTILYLHKLSGLRVGVWNVWGLALLCVLVSNPWSILDLGCLLSFGAVGVLILAHNSIQFVHQNSLHNIQEAIRGQYAITLGLMPLSWSIFYQQSLISPLANALSIPWMSFVSTPVAIAGALFRQDWLIFLADYSLTIQSHWLDGLAQLEWATIPITPPNGWALIMISLGCLMLILPRGLFPRWLGLVLISPVLISSDKPEHGSVWLEVHDVGQGSAVTIQTSHHTLLFDTGPAFNESASAGRRIIWPFFQSRGISKLDSLWISHDDQDHSGGALFLMQKMKIQEISSSLSGDHPLSRLAAEKGASVKNCHDTVAWSWDGVRFEPISIPSHQFKGDNNHSCLLRITAAHHSILLTGDIESEVERWLIPHKPGQIESSVLFMPHHGSKSSSSREFIQHVSPKIALVQAGWKNQFNHPHPEVVARYATQGVKVYSTAQLGALRLKIGPDSGEIEIDCSRFSLRRYWHLHETSASLQSNCHF